MLAASGNGGAFREVDMGLSSSDQMSEMHRAVEKYILAKDGNRPWLLRQAFAANAAVEMVVHTDSIAFPANISSLVEISEVLVRRFNQTYENIYTFCIGSPPESGELSYGCKWMVGMSVKDSGEVRAGCGEYLWQLDAETGLVTHLRIRIELMQVGPASELVPLMDWLGGLSYPWCTAEEALLQAPPLDSLEQVTEYLRRSVESSRTGADSAVITCS
ncbi:hypothetical protein [Pseudomonas oryzihabitans]|uniref:hypothetical protein n=1 Tax=Pseudomonas oryzihabitans TaxID=47885 RepID=UPI002854F3E3|nr:hypothetical protein [Pseudomonas psychrotolerans]MDR6679368.1 hypothetical protein [Pseudomonas psychrotolerans]